MTDRTAEIFPIEWNSLWDITTPEETAAILIAWHGDDAAAMAGHVALHANADLRDADYRFWLAVLKILTPVKNCTGPGVICREYQRLPKA